MKQLPTADRLKELLSYAPPTGELRWAVTRGNGCTAGETAGGIDKTTGYCRVRVDDRLLYAHRIIWCMMTGSWPKHQIDHRNRNRTDNRWENLREARQDQNKKNASSRGNSTGHKGVWLAKHVMRYRAEIIADGKKHRLGYFDTAEQAAAAYAEAAARLHGEFSAV
jgi:hypothetical protein